ncbi:hypothetical protein [Ralstonia phage RP12]|uniref:Uncharacterized protein n=1 Tax=Ralstonia phage RP12 TaxID=1923889 RepID=A0A1L7N159_9CAUD|nr:hypothetical protein FDH28_gp187 [Ralstonia phage RP12]BAW19208.1 hypothetical protein [Ralstonia phage RP12]
MPKVLHTNDGIRESVTRPVVFDITRQIQEWTGLSAMTILFNGDAEAAIQPGSDIDGAPAFNNTASRELWRVNVREEHQTDRLLSTAVHQTEYPEFFFDQAIGVFLRPVYSPTILTLEFEYRSTDVNNARRWRDEIRARVSTNRDIRTHVINYSYLIPKEFMPLLEHIWTLREAQAGYGDDLETYLSNHFTQNVTKITNMGDQKGNERWAIAEQQGRIMGQFDFQELPDEPQKQGDTAAWRQTFSYRIYYDCPIATSADYPVLVHNQLIDQQYLMFQPKDDIQTFESRGSRSSVALGAFEVDQLAKPTIRSGIRLPEFHEFYPRSAPRYTLQVLSALIGIAVNPDGSTNRTIMNFNEIDENWEFRKEFIDHLKYDHNYLPKYGESLVNLTVYDGHMPLHQSMFYVDQDLNVVLNFDPDLRRTYYVRLSLLMDPFQLSQGARDRARNNADGLILIGAAVCPDVVKNKQLPQVLGNSNYISRIEGEKFFTALRQCTSTSCTGHLSDHATVQWNTVMILFIETHDKNRMDN